MSRFDAILLDLDGTLVDASAAIADGIRELAAERGLTVPGLDWIAARIGSPPEETWRLLGAPDPTVLTAAFRQHYLPGLPARTRILDGVPQALATLKRDGYALGVATTRETDSARATLAHAGLLEQIDAIVGRDLVQHPKPAPDVLLRALALMDAPPDRALMVGDTEVDVAAAHAAGLPCWTVLGGFGQELALRAAGSERILARGVADLPAALAATA